MGTVIKKLVAFRLNENLLNRLKEEAKKANRSLNNYVECILIDRVYSEPNKATGTRTGKFAGTADTSSMEAFIKSCENENTGLSSTQS
jgi:hypothetical protein